MMGLTLAERRAVTETTMMRYSLADKRTTGIILDEKGRLKGRKPKLATKQRADVFALPAKNQLISWRMQILHETVEMVLAKNSGYCPKRRTAATHFDVVLSWCAR
jgi:hypothetical protein